MEITLSQVSIMMLAEAIADKIKPKDEALLTIEQLAKAINVPLGTVNKWASVHPPVPRYKTGRRYHYKKSEVEKWMSSR